MSVNGASDEGLALVGGTMLHITKDARKLYISWRKYLRLRTFALFN